MLSVLAEACSSGSKQRTASTSAGTTTSAPAPVAPLRIALTTSAAGPEQGFNAKQAASQAGPGLQRFLNRYVTTAFLQPAERATGWVSLLALFDTTVRDSAKRQLDSLSLGSAAAQISAVRPERADASALVLFGGGQAGAATVRLSFDGTADTAHGSGPVRLRAVFQLLNTSAGWRIASFQSKTGGGI